MANQKRLVSQSSHSDLGHLTNPDPAMLKGSCRGKVKHRSKRLANGHLRVKRRDQKITGSTLVAYKCRACGSWHLGNRYRRTED